MGERTADDPTTNELSQNERAAMHEVEVGIEWLLRAQGRLLAFHHAIGHGMDHLDVAESRLRADGYETLADHLRDDILPRGVTGDDRWSYNVVEEFQQAFLRPVTEFEETSREVVTDGKRHVEERAQEQAWRNRSRR